METQRALRHADNRVVIVMAVVFAALVFVIGLVSNDVPSEIPMVQSSFDVAPPVVTQPTAADNPEANPQVAHVGLPKTAASKKEYMWFADDAAQGARPDSQH